MTFIVCFCRLFHDKGGVPFLARLSRSRQHTTKIIFAANKVCSAVGVASALFTTHHSSCVIYCITVHVVCSLDDLQPS